MLRQYIWGLAALAIFPTAFDLTPASAATAGAPAITLDKLMAKDVTSQGVILAAWRGRAVRGESRTGSPRFGARRAVRRGAAPRSRVHKRVSPRRRFVSPRRITRRRALARHGKYIRRRSHWRSWCARHPGKCRRYRYWHDGYFFWYWVPLTAGILLYDDAEDDRCEYWSGRCAENWGYGNANYRGCMRYHNCE